MVDRWVRLLVGHTKRSAKQCACGFSYLDVLLYVEPRLRQRCAGREERSVRRAERYARHLRRGQCRLCLTRLTKMRRALYLSRELDRLRVIPVPFDYKLPRRGRR
jgi:hypothetical protein